MNKLLDTYKMAMVDGPNGGNVYTVRLAMTGMPKEELARLVKQLQDEKTRDASSARSRPTKTN